MSAPDTFFALFVTTIIFLLIGTAVMTVFFSRVLPFAKIYRRLQIHYKDKCPIFTTPPPTYETYGKINCKFGNGRINALISEYFLFTIMAVFVIFTIAGYLLSYDLFGSLVGRTIGVTINPAVDNDIFDLIVVGGSDTSIFTVIIGIGAIILSAQLIMSPYLDYILMRLLFNGTITPPLRDDVKFASLTNYTSLDIISRNLIYGTSCMFMFYFSAKILSVILFGVTLVSTYNVYIIGASIAFSAVFMIACRSISLLEMITPT